MSGLVPLTIITPCYNEQDVIPHLASTLEAFAAQAGRMFDLTLLFVDDGSQDATWQLLNQYFPPSAGHLLLRHESNQGIAGAIVSGFARAPSEFVAVIDADCTFHPAQLAEMFDLMRDDVDVVTASPLHASGAMQDVPAWRQAMSFGAAWLYRQVLRQRLTSYTSCFRIFRRPWIQDLRIGDYGFCGVTEILARLDIQGAKFAEYPAVLGTREHGVSKINTLKTIAQHLRMLSRLLLLKWFARPLPTRELPRLSHGG